MAGTKIGGMRAAATNKAKWGEDFYRIVGKRGGSNGRGEGYKGGFASGKLCNCHLIEGEHRYVRCAGMKGGYKSKRGSKKQEILTPPHSIEEVEQDESLRFG